MARRKWFQYSLKSLMVFVVVICLGLGGWHLLLKYGQYVEAEPAVVGQPIKIRGRFFHFFVGNYDGECDIENEGPEIHMITVSYANNSWGWCYAIEAELHEVDEPGVYTLTLTPRGGSTIQGANFFVRAAD